MAMNYCKSVTMNHQINPEERMTQEKLSRTLHKKNTT